MAHSIDPRTPHAQEGQKGWPGTTQDKLQVALLGYLHWVLDLLSAEGWPSPVQVALLGTRIVLCLVYSYID